MKLQCTLRSATWLILEAGRPKNSAIHTAEAVGGMNSKCLSHSNCHNTGDPSIGAEIRALVEHYLSDRPGDWRVSMKVRGLNGFERSYTLAVSAGEHQPLAIAINSVLLRLVPANMSLG